MTIVVSIMTPYGSDEEFFDTVDEARDYLKSLHPSTYNYSLDSISVYETVRDIDVRQLLAGEVKE